MRFRLLTPCILFLLLLPPFRQLSQASSEEVANRTEIVLENAPAADESLRLALSDLFLALRSLGYYPVLTNGRGSVESRILIRGQGAFKRDRDLQQQSFSIKPAGDNIEVSSPGIGLVYGIYRLADVIRRDGFNKHVRLMEMPAFPERIFSYQGTLFSLPDEGYYFRSEPFVNEGLLAREIENAKESMRRLQKSSFNTIAFLNLNVEDYVNYDLLSNGFQVYAPDSLHRRRSEIFCRALTELADYAHQLHLQLLLQIYELSWPDHLDGRQLSDDSEMAWKYVQAKFSELFQRTTLDGIIVTPTEPSPRLAYRGFRLWKTPEGAGRMAEHYYDTIVRKSGRRMIFRLWWVARDMEDFQQVLSGAPEAEIMYDTKNTDDDFFLNSGENRLIPGGAGRLRPFSVTFDCFRQYDGWGRLLFCPTHWSERFRSCKRNGVVAVNAWGPWTGGCIFPGSWVGKYDDYDFLRYGFSSAQASLHLFSRLAWNPDQPLEEILREWAETHFGKPGVEAVLKALLLSYDLWKTTYLDETPQSQLAFKWTMLFQAGQSGFVQEEGKESFLGQVFRKHDLKSIQDSNGKALSLAGQIRSQIATLSLATIPEPIALQEFQRAAELTELYFRTFTRWRELLWRSYGWDHGETSLANREELRRLILELRQILPEWQNFPGEAKDWLLFQFDRDLTTAPAWLQRTSVADTLTEISKKVQ